MAINNNFPHDSIKGVAGNFANIYSKYLESPWQFFALSYLTCLGMVIGDKVTLKSQVAPQPRLYTILVGESADDRKSEAIRQATNFFADTLKNSSFNFNLCTGIGSAEGLANVLNPAHNLLVVFDELNSFVSKCKVEGSVLLPCTNTLFEKNDYESATKKARIKAKDVYLSILGASTLETYKRMFSPTFLDIGFLNRLFLVIGEGKRKFSIPQLIPPDQKGPLQAELLGILNMVDQFPKQEGKYVLTLDPKAYELFDSWYLTLERSAFCKRLDSYGHRLLILLTINERQNVITASIAQKTINLLNWQLEVRKLTDPINSETLIARIEESIRRTLADGPLNKRELQQKSNAYRVGLYFWKIALESLMKDGQVLRSSKNNKFWLTEDNSEDDSEWIV